MNLSLLEESDAECAWKEAVERTPFSQAQDVETRQEDLADALDALLEDARAFVNAFEGNARVALRKKED